MSKVFTITEGLENLGALSTGGQGSVYKGKRIGTIITAVKIMPTPIHTESEDDKNFIKFNSEVEKLKKVNEVPNPNVVKIIGSGLTESGSFPFIEMEYIEGPDLEKLLMPPHPPVFTIHETIKVAEQLANALAHCHKVGIKHGDIKSNNVKFNNDTGNYVLLDFGLAITSTEQRRTSLRHAGAVEFMAPEQHDGEMFFQTDVYSYGIILYELLAGTVPFPLINKNETSRNNVMLSHMETPVPDLLALRRNHLPESWDEERKAREMKVPAWLLELIGKCLEKKPERRYANGSALQEAIVHRAAENFAAKPQTVVPDPVKQIVNPTLVDEPAGDEIRLSKPVFAILILLIVILGILSVYGMYFKSDDPNRFANRVDSTQVNHRDTLESIVQRTDTVPRAKPVAVDTAAQKAEIDSLKKEYEAQMAASAKRAQDEAKAKEDKENTIVSNGKKYVLPKGTVYFYEAANATSAKNGVLGLWSNAKFNVIEEQNGFIYVTHSNKDGEVTKGWLNKADLKEVKEQ